MTERPPSREALTIFHGGREELPGLIFYGLLSAEHGGRPQFPTKAWSEAAEPEELHLHGEGWRIIGWELPVHVWPRGSAFESAVRATLAELVSTGARVAWVGAEGIPFVEPPALFDPGLMAGGVLAWMTDDGKFACPLDPDEPIPRISDETLQGLRRHAGQLASSLDRSAGSGNVDDVGVRSRFRPKGSW
jgi:hypothetical protein